MLRENIWLRANECRRRKEESYFKRKGPLGMKQYLNKHIWLAGEIALACYSMFFFLDATACHTLICFASWWHILAYALDISWHTGFFKKTTIHRKHHRCRHYPRSPQLQCCAWKCRTLWTKMVVFFEGRHTHNLEYNIELGDGGNMTCMVLNFIGWLFFFEEPGLRKTQNSIHPFVCFSASCPFCPRGHWLTLCISRCIKTYCTHRIESEVIADLRFSASKISRLPPKILVPATLVPLPKFRDVICVALPMQRTCNTHMQHTCSTHATRHANTSIFPGKFTVNVQDLTFSAQPQS